MHKHFNKNNKINNIYLNHLEIDFKIYNEIISNYIRLKIF